MAFWPADDENKTEHKWKGLINGSFDVPKTPISNQSMHPSNKPSARMTLGNPGAQINRTDLIFEQFQKNADFDRNGKTEFLVAMASLGSDIILLRI